LFKLLLGHRPYGVNSILFNTDESRFYAVSRDSTIYAYSTQHLILGHAPELSTHPSHVMNRYSGQNKAGLGPLYGFRNPNFCASSFYIRAALRKETPEHTELLAVGSGLINKTASPVLFPTDERFLRRPAPPADEDDDELPGLSPRRPTLSMHDTIPIYETGTPLVRGHSSEVTSMTWTRDGELVTVSDDYSVRVWKEDAEQARQLRMGGEQDGQRWQTGWASVEGWDEYD
jgi:hypothetical protein